MTPHQQLMMMEDDTHDPYAKVLTFRDEKEFEAWSRSNKQA